MRLPALITAATCVQALAPTKVLRCVENDSLGTRSKLPKNNLLEQRAKHTIESLYTPEKLPTHRPERLHRAHYLLEHNAVTRRSPRRPRRHRRTATTPSRARRSPRSTRTKPTRCARPSPSCPTSSSRPSSSASRTTSLSSSKSHPRRCPASSSARLYGAWTAATRLF